MNKEKIIDSLERCVGNLGAEPCEKCLYSRLGPQCSDILMEDALELLKEQENYFEAYAKGYVARMREENENEQSFL